jgi:hypothetical protein
VYKNIITGTYPITSFFSRTDDDIRPIGLQAYVQGSGQRNDGSYAYGLTPGIHDPRSGDYEFQDTLKRIQKGRNLFYKGDTISEHALSVLADFLAYCKQRNIHVVGFLPPYAQEIYDMLKESGEYGYMFALDGRLTSIFDRYGGSFFDFSNMESFGGKKNEIVDGLHASEKAYLRLFMNMAEEDSVLQLYAKDSAGLSDLLNTL